MKPIFSGAVLLALHLCIRCSLLISSFFLTGFLSPLSAPPNYKSYTVTQLPPGGRAMGWPLRKAELQKIGTFNLTGYIEARSHQNKGINLAFNWEQNLKGYTLKFLDAENRVFLEMVSDEAKVRLCAKNKTYSARDAELLLKKHLGVSIPLNYFSDWLRGIPSPGVKNERVFNPTKHLLTLNQAGWLIRYLRYHQVRKVDLPTQLFMMKNDGYVRVLVTHWKL